MKKFVACFCFFLLCLCGPVLAASTYSLIGAGNEVQEITVTTSATITVDLDRNARYTVVHLNLQNDGSTASATGDAVFIMNAIDGAGAAVTMAATHADGAKMPLLAGTAATINGYLVPAAAGVTVCTIQLKALSHGAKVLIKREL